MLGSDLHYQTVLYHCLRAHGRVSGKQLGMNVKIWITHVVSDLLRDHDERKHKDYRGNFESHPGKTAVVYRVVHRAFASAHKLR